LSLTLTSPTLGVPEAEPETGIWGHVIYKEGSQEKMRGGDGQE
jgi:hypothetical protein